MMSNLMDVLPIQGSWTGRIRRDSCFVEENVEEVVLVLGNKTDNWARQVGIFVDVKSGRRTRFCELDLLE